ncbi:sigma factor [Amnibacterium sp. CER49]|uniref:RNA polymerase sigma factor n=1 Tax=Amnibacterium sp. CER49 TaxID=3039161 RepID=UPI00244BA183|nr:DUF6596 domain-containing protein [Amnibacterium sp. CER49]MDH2442881.1 sigma factor [Amnibacterium sp. CER49]
MIDADARAVVAEVVARSWGRLIAVLAAPTRDLALAEDVLGDAVERALATWPRDGVPMSPEGWLLTVARRRRTDVLRSAAQRTSVPLDDADADTPAEDLPADAFPDRLLALLFVCAHPGVDPAARTPLMLQTVLGLDARRIASAFAVPVPAMAQRLVRAKRRIRDAGIAFRVPDRARWGERLPAVLEAVYGAYAVGRERGRDADLRGEALHLARLLAELLADDPEVLGLAALVHLAAAVDRPAGAAYVPLDEQDPADWDGALLAEGEAHLRRAAALGRPGRFQLEAALRSAHTARAATGSVDHEAVRRLSAALVRVSPTLGARVAHAVAVARVDGPRAGLALLDEVDAPPTFQPAAAARAALLAEAGLDATDAFASAIALTDDPAVRAWLERQARR